VELHKPEAIVNHYIYMEAIKLSEYIPVMRHPPVRPESVGASDSGHPLWGPVVTWWRLEGVAGALPPLPLVASARVLLHGKGRRENARSKARKAVVLDPLLRKYINFSCLTVQLPRQALGPTYRSLHHLQWTWGHCRYHGIGVTSVPSKVTSSGPS
jgi:hypothetical protein